MPQEIINLGVGPNTATGDPIRTAFQKCNDNFTTLFTGGGGTGSVTSVAITSTTLTVTGSPITGAGTIDIEIPPLIIGNNKLANMPALSVKCNPTSAGGQPQDLVATGSGNQVLQTNATNTALQWGPFGTGVQVRGATWSGGGITGPLDISILNPIDMQITRVTILTKGGTGSCTVDCWTAPVGSYPPTSANSIFNTLPTISAGIDYDDSALTGLNTVHIPAGNVLTFHLVSASTFTEIVFHIALTPTQTLVATGYTDAQAIAAVKAAMTNSGNVVASGGTNQITLNTAGATANPWNQTLSGNGFILLPNGAYIQWGAAVFPNTNPIGVSFNPVFPHHVYNVQLSMTSDLAGQDMVPRIKAGTLTLTGFTIGFDAFGGTFDAPQTVYWQAIGN